MSTGDYIANTETNPDHTKETNPDPLESTHGPLVPDPRPAPSFDLSKPLVGQYVTLEGLQEHHMPSLWQNLDLKNNPELMDYLPWITPTTASEFWLELTRVIKDRAFNIYAMLADPNHLSGPGPKKPHTEVLGIIGYLDPHPAWREVEVGCLLFSKKLQKTVAATEAHYLVLNHAMQEMEPSYRRVSWKCNSLNKASRRAAERLGYVYEGTFRKHMISRGRSRDSFWLSIIDDEWPVVKQALEMWLTETNFDEDGKQVRSLDAIRAELQ